MLVPVAGRYPVTEVVVELEVCFSKHRNKNFGLRLVAVQNVLSVLLAEHPP